MSGAPPRSCYPVVIEECPGHKLAQSLKLLPRRGIRNVMRGLDEEKGPRFSQRLYGNNHNGETVAAGFVNRNGPPNG